MERSSEDYYSLGDIIHRIKGFIQLLLAKWYLVVLFGLLGAGAGLGYYFIQKPKYESVCTFILEEKQSGMGGLSSIASQFGFDIGGMGAGGSIFAGDNILDILKSRRIVQQVLLSKAREGEKDSLSLADLYLDFSGLKKKWKGKQGLESVSLPAGLVKKTSLEDSVLNIIFDGVVKKHLTAERSSKKGTIIRVEVKSPDAVFSRKMTERLVEEAGKLYLNIKTSTTQANIARMQRRSDSLLALLNNKSYVAATVQPLDANPGIKSTMVPTEIALRDKTVIGTLYAEVTKNLEASKLLLSQQSPVIQLLDMPGDSLFDNRMKLLPLLIIGSFVAVFMYVSLLFASYLIRTNAK